MLFPTENIIETAIRNALFEANKQGIRGKEVTPFLLAAVSAATGGASLLSSILFCLFNQYSRL